MHEPNPTTTYPIQGINNLCFLKNIVKNPQIEIGDFTYYHDFENVKLFENNVKYLFPFIGDKLIIGKFCQIASGATFIMNGGNHLTDAISTFPFEIFGGSWKNAMLNKAYPNKGNTVIGNDVWIGHNTVIMPGIQIGDGAIIGSYSIVTKNVEPYTIVGGNPAQLIKKRFNQDKMAELLNLAWWNWPLDKITNELAFLTSSN